SGFYNWKLGALIGPRTLEWPMLGHDIQNSGAYTLPPLIIPQSTNTTQAIRDRVLGEEDRPVQITPLANDLGLPPLQLLNFTQPANGAVTRDSDTVLTYQANKDFAGMDTFNYTMRDATGISSTGRVIIRVKQVNDPPVAEDIHLTMKKNSSVSVF